MLYRNRLQHIEYLLFAMISLLAVGCGSSNDNNAAVDTNIKSVAYLPSCGSVAQANGSVDEKGLFSLPVVDPSFVSASLPIGDLQPGEFTPINYELGFLLNAINVDVTAPADLYVKSITSTEYLSGWRKGEIDFGMGYEVCSHLVNDKEEVAVEGEYAHMTAINDDIRAELMGAPCVEDINDVASTRNCSIQYGNDFFLIEKATLLGSAGGTGLSEYKPGFDSNLLDFRFENTFVNPDRIGADEGPASGYRYGACIYEYFLDPTKTEYLSTVGSLIKARVSETEPCGQLSGIGKAGTAAGIWIPEDKAGLSSTIFSELTVVLGNILILADHYLFPEEQLNISTDLVAVADIEGEATLVDIMKEPSGDINIDFKDMLPGTVYCLEGTSDGGGFITDFYYYLEVIDGGGTLKLERLDSECKLTPEASRLFTGDVMRYVR